MICCGDLLINDYEHPTMWVSLKKSKTVLSTPWRAIPAIDAEKITIL